MATPPSPALRAAREGPGDARNALLERHRAYLELLARMSLPRRLAAKVDPADLAQEALVKAHAAFDGFRGESDGELAAWLRTTLDRTLTDVVRRYGAQARDVGRERGPLPTVEGSGAALERFVAASQTSPSGVAARRETSVLLADALARLEPDHREVIVLRSLEEHDWPEVAQRMGRSPDAVRMLWARALARLRPLAQDLG